MEVSTVSPSPASPTKGDDVCEIDVTNVAIDSVTLLMGLCGLAGNGAFLWLFGFCIRRSPITVYILNLTVADLAFLLFLVPSPVLYLLEEVSCSTVMPLTYRSFLFPMSVFSCIVGLYLLTALSIDRGTSILCPLRCRCHQPQRGSMFVCALLSIFTMAPVIFMCQSQNSEYCRVARVCVYTLNLFLFTPAMVISSTILFIKAKCSSQQREHKRLDIVVSITVLVSVLLTLPLSLWNFLQNLVYTNMSSKVVFLLTCIHSSIKPFIYFLVGSWRRDCSLGTCWRQCSMESCRRLCSMGSLREALQRVFEEAEENTTRSHDAAMDTML